MTEQRLREIIGEAVGEASMCWAIPPKGVFDSTHASQVVDKTVKQIQAEMLEVYNDVKGASDNSNELAEGLTDLVEGIIKGVTTTKLSDHGHGTKCICDCCEGIRGEIERGLL